MDVAIGPDSATGSPPVGKSLIHLNRNMFF
jgi:hypothetical protein